MGMKLYRFEGKNFIYTSHERIKYAQEHYEHRKGREIEELIVVRVNKDPKNYA